MERAAYDSKIIETPDFQLFSAHPKTIRTDQIITVVIEGDGLAWVRPTQPSDNPTPLDPAGFHLAAQYRPGTIYLARPCQFVNDPKCAVRFWTDDRFTPSVINTYMFILNSLKANNPAAQFDLVGYSGGAYIAAILGAQRSDVRSITSVAGVIYVPAWTAFHDVTPLNNVMPIEQVLNSTKEIRVKHICGMRDDVAPCLLAEEVIESASRLGLNNHQLLKLENHNHYDIYKASIFKNAI